MRGRTARGINRNDAGGQGIEEGGEEGKMLTVKNRGMDSDQR